MWFAKPPSSAQRSHCLQWNELGVEKCKLRKKYSYQIVGCGTIDAPKEFQPYACSATLTVQHALEVRLWVSDWWQSGDFLESMDRFVSL
jgi:hypothetical protein